MWWTYFSMTRMYSISKIWKGRKAMMQSFFDVCDNELGIILTMRKSIHLSLSWENKLYFSKYI